MKIGITGGIGSGKSYVCHKLAERGIPVVSALGTGNKLDASLLEVTDLAKTKGCPLARVMRRELKARGIRKMKVVYSKEEPRKVDGPTENGRHIPGSIAFVPSAAGLVLAGEVIRELAGL